MAKKKAARNNGEDGEGTRSASSISDDAEVQGAILNLKGLFAVLSDMGTGAETQMGSNHLAMLANLATEQLACIEAHHFGRA